MARDLELTFTRKPANVRVYTITDKQLNWSIADAIVPVVFIALAAQCPALSTCLGCNRTWLLVAFFLICPLLLFLRKGLTVKSESLLIGYQLGVQFSKRTLFGTHRHTFIEYSRIHDVLINEGFFGNSCIYYMVVVMRDSDRLHLPFERNIPRKHDLFRVYKGTRHVLYNEPDPELVKTAKR